jgi:hypothetical protein
MLLWVTPPLSDTAMLGNKCRHDPSAFQSYKRRAAHAILVWIAHIAHGLGSTESVF